MDVSIARFRSCLYMGKYFVIVVLGSSKGESDMAVEPVRCLFC